MNSDEERAVSPVIGVILMVAITVILAAVIASFVLGLGPNEAAPSAQFEFEEVGDNSGAIHNASTTPGKNVSITHQSGDKIEAQYLYVRGSVSGNWTNGTIAPDEEIGSGDGIKVGQLPDEWELSVVWEKGEQSSEIASEEA